MPLDWKPWVDFVRQHQRFAIATHVRPDPDALGSQLALVQALEDMGKFAVPFIASAWPPRYDFMDPDRRIHRFNPTDPLLETLDAIVVVDTGTWNQLGDFATFVKSTSAARLVIDHHMSQDDLGGIAQVDTTAEAAARLVVEAIDALGLAITPAMANHLFAALATDTGWFRHRNTRPETFALAEKLNRFGADPSILYELIYEQSTLPRMHLLGLVLHRMKLLANGKVAITEVLRSDYEATGAIPQDTEDMVGHTRSLVGVEVGLFFLEQPAGGVKISFRSRSRVDVAKIAEQFGGGGHKLASGAILPTTLPEAKERVLKAIFNAVDSLAD